MTALMPSDRPLEEYTREELIAAVYALIQIVELP